MPKLRIRTQTGLLRGFNPPETTVNRQVKCINKNNRQSHYERISHIGGDWGTISETLAIDQIEQGIYNYHVKVGTNDVKVFVAKHLGNKYLRTIADFTKVDNLLSLPECS